jgi:4-amino-4-deoxy-L-arabinose transferase-like glycosyltransferase
LTPRRALQIATVVAILPLLGWWVTGLFDLDEGFYGAVVAEMNRRGEWITPYFNGSPWFEKPILLYWLAKPCVALFGNMVGPRLPSVLSAIGCFLLVGGYVRRKVSEEAAALSVMALGSSLLFVALGRLMMTDMPLTLAFSAAMFAFWESLVGDARWRILTAALLGVAVLAKGPVALILFALIAGWTFYRERDLRPRFRGWWLVGTMALAAVIASWYVPAYLANGQLFVQKFLIEQNVGRFIGGDQAHTIRAWWAYFLYVPILFLGMMPWSAWIISAARGTSPNHLEDESFRRFLLAWATIIFIFFSVSSAKLPHYILPVVVPVAILVGIHLARSNWRRVMAIGAGWTVVVAIAANVGISWWYAKSGQAEAHSFVAKLRNSNPDLADKSVAVFQLPRRQKELGTGKPKLQETSLPSLVLYLGAPVNEAETAKEVVGRGSRWMFTRKGRITPTVVADFALEGKQLVPIESGENFELYQVKEKE